MAQALREDRTGEDRTGRAIVPAHRKAIAHVLAERRGVVSGLGPAVVLGRVAGLRVRALARDGDVVRRGDRVIEVRGEARAILAAERSLLNLVMHLSGVATATRAAVGSARGHFEILATRKTLPGLRALEKAAVVHGGGQPHRADLASGILVKNNHLRFVGIGSAVGALRRAYGRRWPIEVEVRSVRDAVAAVEAGADAILVDNASPGRARSIIRAARARARGRPLWVEISGGLSAASLARYRRSGADAASLGALTHSAAALPFHLRFAPDRPPTASGRRAHRRR